MDSEPCHDGRVKDLRQINLVAERVGMFRLTFPWWQGSGYALLQSISSERNPP
jgi:hypothetical protein